MRWRRKNEQRSGSGGRREALAASQPEELEGMVDRKRKKKKNRRVEAAEANKGRRMHAHMEC